MREALISLLASQDENNISMAFEMNKSLNAIDDIIKNFSTYLPIIGWDGSFTEYLVKYGMQINIKSKNVSVLPAIPDGIEYLNCADNSIKRIENLPNSLKKLVVDNNNIQILQSLPSGLIHLSCGFNKIKSMPFLPTNLKYLDCEYNNMVRIPYLPKNIQTLYCRGNNFDSKTMQIILEKFKKNSSDF